MNGGEQRKYMIQIRLIEKAISQNLYLEAILISPLKASRVELAR